MLLIIIQGFTGYFISLLQSKSSLPLLRRMASCWNSILIALLIARCLKYKLFDQCPSTFEAVAIIISASIRELSNYSNCFCTRMKIEKQYERE